MRIPAGSVMGLSVVERNWLIFPINNKLFNFQAWSINENTSTQLIRAVLNTLNAWAIIHGRIIIFITVQRGNYIRSVVTW